MAFAIQIDGAVDIDMCDSQFLLSLKPASKEEEVEEKIQRIAEGKARDGVDISVNDALDYIASITKLGKTYYQARSSFVWQYLQVCNIHYINLQSFLVPSLTPLSSLSSCPLQHLILIPIHPSRINGMPGYCPPLI